MKGPFVPLSVGYYENERVLKVTPMAELLYVRGLAFSKGKMLAGVLGERQVARLAADLEGDGLAAELELVGLWSRTPDGWLIEGWAEWNALDTSRAAGVLGNHERWHVRRGLNDPDCPHCLAPRLAPRLAPESQNRVEKKRVEESRETPPSTVVDKRADPTYRFDDFWSSYPQRKGRRVGRAKALERWKRLSYDDKAAAFRGVTHYRADCDAERTIAKDAERWLRDRCWEDWQDEAEPSRSLSKQERRLVDLGLVDGFLEACTPNGQPAITTGQVTQ